MSEVHAIKSKEQIDMVENFLLKHYGGCFSDIWKLGVNMALRASDLLSITIDDAKKAIDSGHFIILEQKTAYKTKNKGTDKEERVRTKTKPRVIKLNKTAHKIITDRLDDHHNDYWLFQSIAKNHKGDKKGVPQPLSYQSVWAAMKAAGESIGVKMGTHTMRKTRGYAMHKAGISIEQICRTFNHSDPSITMHYIGLVQESIDKTYEDIEL